MVTENLNRNTTQRIVLIAISAVLLIHDIIRVILGILPVMDYLKRGISVAEYFTPSTVIGLVLYLARAIIVFVTLVFASTNKYSYLKAGVLNICLCVVGIISKATIFFLIDYKFMMLVGVRNGFSIIVSIAVAVFMVMIFIRREKLLFWHIAVFVIAGLSIISSMIGVTSTFSHMASLGVMYYMTQLAEWLYDGKRIYEVVLALEGRKGKVKENV